MLEEDLTVTTCTTCHRALYKKDGDENGNCEDCRNLTPVQESDEK